MNKHELFAIIQTARSTPPIFFPETIVVGFKCRFPCFVNFPNQKIEFLQINSCDAKLIGVCWRSELLPLFVVKAEAGEFECSDLSLITLQKKNVIFQKYVHHELQNKFRVTWNKNRRLKLYGWDSRGIKVINSRTSRLSPDHLKVFSDQVEYIIKLIKKYLHLNYVSELTSLSLDFIINTQIFCLGIHCFEYKPILSLNRYLASSPLNQTLHPLQSQCSILSKTSTLKPAQSSSSIKRVSISNLKNLTRKMRLIISQDKPKAQLLEGIQSEVESILNSSQIE